MIGMEKQHFGKRRRRTDQQHAAGDAVLRRFGERGLSEARHRIDHADRARPHAGREKLGQINGKAGKRPEPQQAPALNPSHATGYVNPVCGAVVDPTRAMSTLTLSGQTHYFCCKGCRVEFERDPDKYLAIAAHMRAPATRS